MLACAILLSVLCGLSFAQPSCKTYDFQMQPDFNITAFEGHWYVISSKRSGSVFWNAVTGETMNMQLHFTMLPFGRLEVMASGSSLPYGCFYSIHSAVPVPESNLTKYDFLHTKYKLPGDSMWIVSTDYDGFAVTYGCDEILPQSGYCDPSTEVVYTLNRKVTGHTPEQLGQIEDALNSVCVSSRTLKPMHHHGECAFDPEQFPPTKSPDASPSAPAPTTGSLLSFLSPGNGSYVNPTRYLMGVLLNRTIFNNVMPQMPNNHLSHMRNLMNLFGK